MKRLTWLFLALASTCLAATPAVSAADGLPVPVDYSLGEGVIDTDGEFRFVTVEAGDRTLVMRIATDGGEVTDHAIVDGDYTIPAVAVDGTAGGISHDGATLALINPRDTFPRTSTQLRVYDTERLRREPVRIDLDGDFSYDALSPDGSTLYLTEYPDPRDLNTYQVRSFDIASKTLDPDPILDTEEDPDEMRGLPQTRATSPDGRWAFTVYDGGGGHPFVHALDLVEGRTVCIDLDDVKPKETRGAKLAFAADGGSATLTDRTGTELATVDAQSLEATPAGAERAAASEAGSDSEGSTLSVWPAAIAAGLVLLGAGAWRLRGAQTD